MALLSAITRSSPASFRERASLITVPSLSCRCEALCRYHCVTETTEDASVHNHRQWRAISERSRAFAETKHRRQRGSDRWPEIGRKPRETVPSPSPSPSFSLTSDSDEDALVAGASSAEPILRRVLGLARETNARAGSSRCVTRIDKRSRAAISCR